MGKVVATLLQDRKINMAHKASDLGATQGRELLDDNFGLLLVYWFLLFVIPIIVL
jgi:hypothetical protein